MTDESLLDGPIGELVRTAMKLEVVEFVRGLKDGDSFDEKALNADTPNAPGLWIRGDGSIAVGYTNSATGALVFDVYQYGRNGECLAEESAVAADALEERCWMGLPRCVFSCVSFAATQGKAVLARVATDSRRQRRQEV